MDLGWKMHSIKRRDLRRRYRGFGEVGLGSLSLEELYPY